MPTQQQTQAAQNQQINAFARQAIRSRGVRRNQVIFDQTFNTPIPPTITVQPRNVGLVMGFWVKVVAVITNQSTSSTLTLSDFGPANILSQLQLNDLQNNTRIQDTGFHLNLIQLTAGNRTVISQLPLSESMEPTPAIRQPELHPQSTRRLTTVPISTTISAPASIAAHASSVDGTGTVLTMWYYVPLAYNPDNPKHPGFSRRNLRQLRCQRHVAAESFSSGCFPALRWWLRSVQTPRRPFTSRLRMTPCKLRWRPMRVEVYQDYYDQLPTGNAGVLLPILDLATIYELKYTSNSNISVGQDFPYQYANFRQFLSTFAVFVNTGATGARGVGADVNYWALQAANFSNIWKEEPQLVALRTRQHLGVDLPPGCYMFDSRNRPISTTQYGNMELILNASTAGSGAYQLTCVEDFAIVQTLSMAGSLQAIVTTIPPDAR